MNKPGLLIDMDGVLYRGDAVIPDAIQFVESIQDYPHLFVTNNSAATQETVLEKLHQLGFWKSRSENIFTAAMATAAYLNRETPGFTYYAVGGPGVHAALSICGYENDEDPDYVVVGEGEGISYSTLTHGVNLLMAGKARLIGTNPDFNLDGSGLNGEKVLPGGGALIAPFRAASGVNPVFVGKPNAQMYLESLQILGMFADQAVMIGDRPDTDILGASKLGIKTVLVRTGRFTPDMQYPDHLPLPDLMVDSLAEIDPSNL